MSIEGQNHEKLAGENVKPIEAANLTGETLSNRHSVLQILNDQEHKIAATALGTAWSMAHQTSIANARPLFNALQTISGITDSQIPKIETPHFYELRNGSTDKVLKESIEKKEIVQTVELAAGFTPHTLNLRQEYSSLHTIENDFPSNLELKERAMQSLKP